MTRLLLVSVVAFALVGCSSSDKTDTREKKADDGSTATSPEKPAGPQKVVHELPFNPFARVASGDWVAVIAKVHYEGKTPDKPFPAVSVWSWTGMSETDAENAVLLLESGPAIPDFGGKRTWAKKKVPSVEDFFALDPADEVTDVKREEAKRTIGDKEFVGRKVTVDTKSGEHYEVWLSPDVPVNGVVAMKRKMNLGEGVTEIDELEVAGFKSADPPLSFGKTPSELAASFDGK